MTEPVVPLLSVCFITYNHEKYIRQSLDSVLSQQTNFPFEVIIGEDCSTDRTREIVFEYKKRYPVIITVVTGEINIGAQKNVIRTLKACGGKYVAVLEGDDYWTDHMKLQKQVDFLEENIDYSLIHTGVIGIDGNDIHIPAPYKKWNYQKQVTKLNDALYLPIAFTCSALFVNPSEIIINTPLYGKLTSGDWGLWVLLTLTKKAYFMPDYMAAYRMNVGVSKNIVWEKNYLVRAKFLADLVFSFSLSLRKKMLILKAAGYYLYKYILYRTSLLFKIENNENRR